jgi:Flp pilus assembly pilin Flp
MRMLGTVPSRLRARLGRRAGERGVTAVEYALMVAIIALLLVGGFVVLFNSVSGKFGSTANCVQTPGGTGCPTPTSAAP